MKMKSNVHALRSVLLFIVLGTFAALPLGCEESAAPTDDFSGKTIEWVVPFNPGGGTDTWARFNAPFFQKYLPGNPTVAVENIPGGASIVGANQFAARAEPDGTRIIGTSGSTQFPFLLEDARVRYDYADWTTFVASPTGGVVYVKPGLGIESASELDELQDAQLTYASQGPTSLDLVPLLAFRMLNLDVEHVFGFKGRAEGRIAFQRGETNIDYQTTSSYLKNVEPLVKRGEAIPLFSWGALDEEGNIVRDPTFPDLPHFAEVYQKLTGNELKGTRWDAYRAFFISGFAAQKMGFVPEDTPPEIVHAYQDAVRKMRKDPEYQKRKQAVLGEYEQVTGEAAKRLKELGTQVSPEARRFVIDMLKEDFNVDLDG